MRQAVLILAHKNEKQICDIINYLGEDFEFYIHIDKKSKMNLKKIIMGKNNIHVFRKYVVNWAGSNIIKATLFLSKKALEDTRNKYFHLISGQDFPVKTGDYFYNKLDTSKSYLKYFEMPIKRWGNGGGMDRIEQYHFYDVFDVKTRIGEKIIEKLTELQRRYGIKKKKTLSIFFEKLYGGSQFWSLTRDCLQYVVDCTNKSIIKCIRFTKIIDEIYFQTVLLNSKYADNIVNDNLRYIDWTLGRRGFPAFLDKTDYDKIILSNKIFARKFHETDSEELKTLLMNNNI
jgi:hypothetical protein